MEPGSVGPRSTLGTASECPRSPGPRNTRKIYGKQVSRLKVAQWSSTFLPRWFDLQHHTWKLAPCIHDQGSTCPALVLLIPELRPPLVGPPTPESCPPPSQKPTQMEAPLTIGPTSSTQIRTLGGPEQNLLGSGHSWTQNHRHLFFPTPPSPQTSFGTCMSGLWLVWAGESIVSQ